MNIILLHNFAAMINVFHQIWMQYVLTYSQVSMWAEVRDPSSATAFVVMAPWADQIATRFHAAPGSWEVSSRFFLARVHTPACKHSVSQQKQFCACRWGGIQSQAWVTNAWACFPEEKACTNIRSRSTPGPWSPFASSCFRPRCTQQGRRGETAQPLSGPLVVFEDAHD